LGTVALDLAVTVVLEVGLFAAAGFRGRAFLGVCALVNVLTNLSLHLVLALARPAPWWAVVAALELVVIVVEWACLRPVAPPDRRSLLPWLVMAANALSFGAGLIING
jgi:hypothetical protein